MSDDTAVPFRVLIADDQRDVLEALRLLLKGEGYVILSATSPAEVTGILKQEEVDVLLMDLNYARDTTSGKEGLDLLTEVQALDSMLPVVVMTAWGSVEVAVEAMRRGARDFLEKPWDDARLLSIVATQCELSRALRRGERLQAAHRVLTEDDRPRLIARSPAMRPVLDLIERVGPSPASVLITGENGTGKGLVARLLHSVSPRSEGPLVTVNIGGLSETVFESELFGHVEGAFTDARSDRVGRFEMADGGTLFLDEVGNLPPALQARLLRVVETGEFERVGSSRTQRADVRILAATNTDLEEAVAAERFRKDLLYRLRTVEIQLPPLRERTEDIPLLAAHFLQQHARRYDKPMEGFESAAMEALRRHPWPGNVRELDHSVERAVLMARGDRVAPEDLGLRPPEGEGVAYEQMTLEEVERVLIRKALRRHDGNVTRAAEDLGLSRSALYRRLDKHELA
ncbi:MAG: sigma-54 dependent transcriptional regulator [Thermoanaerobaculia bacterium]|nr:sigma-54 dependent transcriptional regulator [Thermoanaerobaculia bacterium]